MNEKKVELDSLQRDSDDSSHQFRRRTTSSNDDFDLERFRLSKIATTTQPTTSTLNNNHTSLRTWGNDVLYQQEENIKILGISFPVKHLLERHRNPILVLKLAAFFTTMGHIVNTILFTIGTRFNLVLSINCILSQISIVIYVIIVLKKSIVNGLSFQLKEYGVLASVQLTCTVLVVYSFIKVAPFNSIAFFLQGFFLATFFYTMMNACITLHNHLSQDDPNYQSKYFIQKFMFGVINATGFVDVLSDIALGIQIIQKYEGYLQILGISMFVLCLLDFGILNIRLFSPDKVTITMHAWAIVLEIVILVTSVLVALQLDKSNTDWEFVLLLVFSFVSTVVNFIHHIFVIVQWYFVQRKKRKQVTLVNIFE